MKAIIPERICVADQPQHIEETSGIEQLDHHSWWGETPSSPIIRFVLDFTLGALVTATLFLFLK